VQEYRILSSWDEEYPANISMSGKEIFYVGLYFEKKRLVFQYIVRGFPLNIRFEGETCLFPSPAWSTYPEHINIACPPKRHSIVQ